jgi:hypothetical protein
MTAKAKTGSREPEFEPGAWQQFERGRHRRSFPIHPIELLWFRSGRGRFGGTGPVPSTELLALCGDSGLRTCNFEPNFLLKATLAH